MKFRKLPRKIILQSTACALLMLITGMGIAHPPIEDDDSLHIHFISGSEEYKSEESLKELKQKLEQEYEEIKITASWGQDAGDNLPNISLLDEADLMLVFTRRMTLPEDQLEYILQHIEAEKPVIGLRTASHAFQGFLQLDPLIFGGDYDGHGDEEPVTLSIAEGSEHPILNGVETWNRPGKIYLNPNLGPNTEVLVIGEGLDSGVNEPMAWTNHYGHNGRAFYTSMGLPSDFDNENFLQLLTNAIAWTTDQELH
ncbi:MAG: ThuA domain-containing protein [Balneolales bacterium]